MNWLRHGLRALPLCAAILLIVGTSLPGVNDAPSLSNQIGGHCNSTDQAAVVKLSTLPNAEAAVQREQTLARLGVLDWHKDGWRGQGIKVAVFDTGFHDYQSFLGTALPAHVTLKSFRRDGDLEARESQHGILCAEVIHAMAPEAELLLVNWEPDRPESLLQAVRWAAEQGAKVLSCSLVMPSWSDGEGGGEINAALTKIIAGGEAGEGVLFFASAGNLAQRHWSGPVRPDNAGYHQWNSGQRNNILTPWGEERVSVEIYGPKCLDLDLQVFDATTAKLIGHSRASRDGSPSGSPCAVVRFQPRIGGQYIVRVRSDKVIPSSTNNSFHLVALGGALQQSTSGGSIAFPADCPAAIAVGAVDGDRRRLSYSSCGPNSRLPKPDYVAEVPFPSLWRDRPFAGTSAAAPQAAALACMLWSQHPDWTAQQVNQSLRQASCDIGPLGHDWETGYGLLRLPARPIDMHTP